MDKIDDQQKILQLFQDASNERFFGVLTFRFQDGIMNLIRKEATIKIAGLDFSTSKIDGR